MRVVGQESLSRTHDVAALYPAGSASEGRPPTEGRSTRMRARNSPNVHRVERVVSSIGGALLVADGLRRGSLAGVLMTLAGGGLIYRGVRGHCPVYQAIGVNTAHERAGEEGGQIERTITIDRSPEELHRFWSSPPNLGRIMAHFATVEIAEDGAATWKVRTPLGQLFAWHTRVVEDREGEVVRWQSGEDARPAFEGMLRFARAPGDRGTRVTLALRFQGKGVAAIGGTLMQALRMVPSTLAFKALQRFKSLVETGEIPTGERTRSMRDVDPDRSEGAAAALGWFSLALGLLEVATPNRVARVAGIPFPRILRVFGLRELVSGVGILSLKQRPLWLWSRVAGDAMDLALLGLALKSQAANRTRTAVATAAVVGVTAADALTSWKQGKARAQLR